MFNKMASLVGFVIGLCLVASAYGKYTYETKYLDVPLDHFSFFNNRTFKLRYLLNDTFWKPKDGPVFFYAGNEGDIEMFAQHTGFLWEVAEKFKALVVFAEHRYYGKSLPPRYKCNHTNYYEYLSTHQVMADYVDVLYELKSHQKSGTNNAGRRKSKQSNPVIAFGGSFGGMLASWMRMKYPAVIEGALASSAPIFYFSGMTPCDGFHKTLTNVYNDTNTNCTQNIRKSWKVLRTTLKEEKGKQWINKNWKLCEPIKAEDNVTQLLSILSEVYSGAGMVNYPYATDFLMPLPAYPVKEMCKPLSNSSLSGDQLLNAIYRSVSIYLNYSGKSKCLDWTKAPYGSIDMDAWGMQACSEIVMPMCTNGVTDMFEPNPWNYTQYSEQCYDYYKSRPKEKFIEREYGGKDLRQASNIIFSNGLLDPWSSGGVLENVSPSVVTVVLPDAAHHLDLRAAHVKDPHSVKRARKLYVNIFRRWIRNYRKKTPTAN